MASLYISRLHPDVTEAMLLEKFSTTGRVLSISVCRNTTTQRSLGYAFINFQQSADAEHALTTMNHDEMNGQSIRIVRYEPDPSNRKSGNVFIKNLDQSIDDKALYDTLSAFGNILSCKIVSDENGSKGYGFVDFETEEAARNAIEKVNGMLLNGKELFVCQFMSRKERIEQMGKFTNVYIKNFSDDLDENDLREMFENYGNLVSVKLVTDETGISKGFGFVNFEDTECAEKAVEELNGKEVGGRPLDVNSNQNANLYVKNLDDNIDNKRLHKEFSQFGTITSATVMIDKDSGRSKGFGFVCFTSPDEAIKALMEMNGRTIVSKPLYVALAQRKEDRKAHLASQCMQRIYSFRSQGPAPQQFGQMYQPNSAGYFFIPTMPHAQRPSYFPNQIQGMQPNPRWSSNVRQPGQPTAKYYMPTMPHAQRLSCSPNQIQGMRPCPRWSSNIRQPNQPTAITANRSRKDSDNISNHSDHVNPDDQEDSHAPMSPHREEDTAGKMMSAPQPKENIWEVWNSTTKSTPPAATKPPVRDVCNDEMELEKKVRSILNKLTPRCFQTLVKQMESLNIDSEQRLKVAIDLIFERAISEPRFIVTYANMCKCLMMYKVPSESKKSETVTFRVLLANKCQKEFKKLQRSKKEKVQQLKDEYEAAEAAGKCRSIGNITFIGELFKLKMLTETIMHGCVYMLLRSRNAENLECLCSLLMVIGKELDLPKAKSQMDQYFSKMIKIIDERKTSARVRFMLQDVIELRKSSWVPRCEDNNPKTIDQIHHEIKKEQVLFIQNLPPAQQQRCGRPRGGPGSSGGPPVDGGWNTVSAKTMRPQFDMSKFKIPNSNADENIYLMPTRFRRGRGCSDRGSNPFSDADIEPTPNRCAALSKGEDDSRNRGSDDRRSSPATDMPQPAGGHHRGKMGGRSSQEYEREQEKSLQVEEAVSVLQAHQTKEGTGGPAEKK